MLWRRRVFSLVCFAIISAGFGGAAHAAGFVWFRGCEVKYSDVYDGALSKAVGPSRLIPNVYINAQQVSLFHEVLPADNGLRCTLVWVGRGFRIVVGSLNFVKRRLELELPEEVIEIQAKQPEDLDEIKREIAE